MADVNNAEAAARSIQKLRLDDNVFDNLRKQNATADQTKVKEYFEKFDLDRDGFLDASEFSTLLQHVFSNKGVPYAISDKQQADMLKLLDENQDGKIDMEEFKVCWIHWLKQILDPVSALIIVDVQNDFISGTMAIKDCPAGQDGAAVVPTVNAMLDAARFDLVVYSADWHPDNHISFIENVRQRKLHPSTKVSAENAENLDTVVFAGPPITEQKMWPAHCVQHSWGAELHPDLKIVPNALYINKGTNPEIDSYSAFWDNKKLSQTSLVDQLTRHGVTDIYVCGLAYDVCVGATALHALEHGFRTSLVEDATRGVFLSDIETTRQKLTRQGAAIVTADQVADMVNALDRRPELGHQAALNVAMARNLVKEAARGSDGVASP